MKKTITGFAAAIFMALTAVSAQSATLVEGFDGEFPAWESGWLATNSNLKNYYGVGKGRGNQPYGLWVDDLVSDRIANVEFDSEFGALWTSFSMDVATFVGNNVLTVYDTSGDVLGEFSDFKTRSYSKTVSISVTSTNGIGGFKFSSKAARGNTWIDNVSVSGGYTANSAPAPVPLPAGLPLLMAAIGTTGFLSRKSKKA